MLKDVTPVYLGGYQSFAPPEHVFCDPFLVTVVGQMVLGRVRCLSEIQLLPFLLCKMANFQSYGGDSPFISSFVSSPQVLPSILAALSFFLKMTWYKLLEAAGVAPGIFRWG